jgi:hypothetical protein
MNRMVISLLLFVGMTVHADTEIMWVKLQVNRTYHDLEKNCFGNSAQGQILFSAELKDGVIKAAQIQNYPNIWPYSLAVYSARELSDNEIQAIKLFRDKRGEWWVTRLSLSEPSLRWALYESAKTYSFCPAPLPLETVQPNGFTFEFETEGLEEGIWVAESTKTEVFGKRKDGHPYTGSLQFTQREFKDGF